MKGKIIKQEKGITLIALVITIIVLLILAGVAISMLSGENGILNQAAESKEKTESESFIEQVRVVAMGAMTNKDAEINKNELITELNNLGIEEDDIISYGNGEYLIIKGTEKIIINNNGKVEYDDEIKEIDIELQKYFNKQKLDYNCKYGYVTGFKYYYDEETKEWIHETVAEVEANLDEGGYKIISKYKLNNVYVGGSDEAVTQDENISTGMVIAKDGKEVARTVLFGDINCDGNINTNERTLINIYFMLYNIMDLKDFQKVAMNMYEDNEINTKDRKILNEWIKSDNSSNLQTSTAIYTKNVKTLYTELQQYISLLDAKTGYSFEYNEETDTYKLKGVKEGTTAENLINSLPRKDKISVNLLKYDEGVKRESISGESIVEDGYYLRLQLEESEGWKASPFFAYIETEKSEQQ